ncbi:MAG: 5'-3' exonuclease H3TH domain-containing protein [Candidatus Peribacteraceae bacterium]|nr:5'-3' exonuclease H3TH domain-containing protein [Candidatus Peribacteraceae bacterium]MDD5074269.1 5'-3' exonuclease H3TH domain-containing protein [Candidatus Peribacteraceae bacterium]
MDHLVLIDGHHLMYRAYWAIPRTLKTSKGEQTNAVFGVASMLLTILSKERPDALLFCFDEGDETFRHQEAVDYKAGRAETPDDFYVQIPRILELIHAFSIQHVSDRHFEADDLLCAYARHAEKEGMRVTIVTGDRDALQLASEHVRIAIPHKGYQAAEYLGPAEIETKYGVRPDQIVSYKGLTGDSSDNLPGVKGIGPKTAAQLLQRFGTLKGVYEHLTDIAPAVREKLERDREQAFFCERMSQLIEDIPLPFALPALRLTNIPAEPVEKFFRDFEFTLLLRRLQSLLQTPFGQEHFIGGSPSVPAPSPEKKSQLSLF